MATTVWRPSRGEAYLDLRPRLFYQATGATIPAGHMVERDTTNHGFKKITNGGMLLGISKDAVATASYGIVWTKGEFEGVSPLAEGETTYEPDRVSSASTDGTIEVQATGSGYAVGTVLYTGATAKATTANVTIEIISSLDYHSTT